MPRSIKYPKISSLVINTLEKYLNNRPLDYNDARNKLLISFFYYQGLKTSIVQRLTYQNYDVQNNILTFPLNNKLSKYLEICPEDTTQILLGYLQEFKRHDNQRLIRNIDYKTSRTGFPITIRQLQRIIQETGAKLGLPKKLNPRTLRHLCAVRLTKENLMHSSLDHLIGRVSPWVFTEYKKLAGNPRKHGQI